MAALIAVAACSGGDDADDCVGWCPSDEDGATTLPPLLTAADLGDGWIESDAAPVPMTPAAVATPCPFTAERPDITVSDAASVALSNEVDELGIVHTVVELDGDPASVDAVSAAWATMDCEGADFEQAPLEGLGDNTVGVVLEARNGPLTQVVTVESLGSAMSFMVISGNDDGAVALAQSLAD